MQRGGMLNSHIAKVLADLGHTDSICIGDCGLPIPDAVPRIDLALRFGVPSFVEVFDELLRHMRVEVLTLACELEESAHPLHALLVERAAAAGISVRHVPHAELKRATHDCRAVIRTGEIIPYANAILYAGCIFAPEEKGTR